MFPPPSQIIGGLAPSSYAYGGDSNEAILMKHTMYLQIQENRNDIPITCMPPDLVLCLSLISSNIFS